MTLAIGLATEDVVFLGADTLLSAPLPMRDDHLAVDPRGHALKLHILNARCVVAFAGDVAQSIRCIGELNAALQTHPEWDPAATLFRIYGDQLREAPASDCEFLVGTLRPNRLAKVNGLGIQFDRRSFIGSPEGYQALSSARVRYQPPPHRQVQQGDGTFVQEINTVSPAEVEYMELRLALGGLCSRRVPSIGALSDEPTIVVNARESGNFEYMSVLTATSSTAEPRGGYSLIASNTATLGVGICYRIGGFGYVFPSGIGVTCARLPAPTVGAFIDASRERFGMELIGGEWQ